MVVEHAIGQFLFVTLLFSFALTALVFWLFYYCIKCAVRDGIKEALPRAAWRETIASHRPRSDGLPDMRAD